MIIEDTRGKALRRNDVTRWKLMCTAPTRTPRDVVVNFGGK